MCVCRVWILGGQNEGIKIIRRRVARDTVVNRLSRFLSDGRVTHCTRSTCKQIVFCPPVVIHKFNIIIIIVGSLPHTYISCAPGIAVSHSSITQSRLYSTQIPKHIVFAIKLVFRPQFATPQVPIYIYKQILVAQLYCYYCITTTLY